MAFSWMMKVCLFISVLTHVVHSSVEDGLVVSPWGKIQGVPDKSSSGLPITRFEGIPYAKPPLGNLRFSKPVPSSGSNKTIHMADAVRPSCLVDNKTRESEDCLYLDMYVPRSKTSVNASVLPVMVFIHGGSFLRYTSPTNADRLLRKDVIVVFVHYRLGAMGFLSNGDDILKGNYGLWDQRMAIEWVKENVASFGGDQNTLTVFGQSAGAASVAYQLLAPNANNLFKRAILQSGTVTSTWAFVRTPAVHAQALGLRVGCAFGNSSEQFAKCLRGIDGVHLQKEMFALLASASGVEQVSSPTFVPVIDNEFILDEPMKLIRNKTHLQSVGVLDKDIIIGINNNEGEIIKKIKSLPTPPKFGEFFAKQIAYELYLRYGVSTPQMEKAAVDFYRQSVSMETLNKNQVTNAYTDLLFIVPSLEFMNALSESGSGSGSRYLYYFDYCVPFLNLCMGHGFELAFEFTMENIIFFTEQKAIADKFSSLVTTFARSGVPTAQATPAWTRFSRDSNTFMRITVKPEVKQNLLPKRMDFWFKTMPKIVSASVNANATNDVVV